MSETSYYQEVNETKVDNRTIQKHESLQTKRVSCSSGGIQERGLVSMTYSSRPTAAVDNETQSKIEIMMHNNGGKWNCRTCHFNSKVKSHVKEHVQTHMDLEFPCSLCGKIMRSSKAFRRHSCRQQQQ